MKGPKLSVAKFEETIQRDSEPFFCAKALTYGLQELLRVALLLDTTVGEIEDVKTVSRGGR